LSALPALRALRAAGAPVAILGAGRNGDCIPREAGYVAFWRECAPAAPGPGGSPQSSGGGGGRCFLAVARDAGHLQFLEGQTTLQRWAGRGGEGGRRLS
jgi:hypothetical protein